MYICQLRMGSSRNTNVKVNLQFGAIPFVIHAEGFVREPEPLRGTYRGPVSQRYIPNNVTLKKRNRLHFMTGASLRLGPGKKRAARAARLVFLIQPIKSSLFSVVISFAFS